MVLAGWGTRGHQEASVSILCLPTSSSVPRGSCCQESPQSVEGHRRARERNSSHTDQGARAVELRGQLGWSVTPTPTPPAPSPGQSREARSPPGVVAWAPRVGGRGRWQPDTVIWGLTPVSQDEQQEHQQEQHLRAPAGWGCCRLTPPPPAAALRASHRTPRRKHTGAPVTLASWGPHHPSPGRTTGRACPSCSPGTPSLPGEASTQGLVGTRGSPCTSVAPDSDGTCLWHCVTLAGNDTQPLPLGLPPSSLSLRGPRSTEQGRKPWGGGCTGAQGSGVPPGLAAGRGDQFTPDVLGELLAPLLPGQAAGRKGQHPLPCGHHHGLSALCGLGRAGVSCRRERLPPRGAPVC